MELRQLNTFIRIVQMQSFSKAAESLGYSQSAVTVQIRLLEEELNTRLFDRIGKRINLTSQGKEFLSHAHSILHEVNKAQLSVGDETELKNELHIGTIESLCSTKLPPILHHFRLYHPNVAIRITTASPEELLEMMNHNQLDLIYILDEPRYNNRWNRVMETKESIVFVSSPTCRLAGIRNLKLEELLSMPFFLTEQNANYRRAFDRFLAAKKRIVTPLLECSNTQFILKMIEQNEGISLLPYFAVQESAEQGKVAVLNVTNFRLSMYRQIFYHKDKWKTREMDEFIRLASSVYL
ncbi:MAG: LysR family transcriptional regulator [Lachnospiraceae bacterium]|nr:LysR family transcriptional regulator [Lachnospiraceae bacterium]